MALLGYQLYVLVGFGRICFWNNTTAPSIAESIAPGPAAGVSKRFRSPCPSAWHFRRTVRKGEFTELNEDERPAIGSAGYRSQVLCSSFLALQERARRLHRYQQFADVQQRGQGSAAWCGASRPPEKRAGRSIAEINRHTQHKIHLVYSRHELCELCPRKACFLAVKGA